MADETPVSALTDSQLTELAEGLAPAAYLGLLRDLTELDEKASQAARDARHQLNLLIKVGLERPDIIKERMVEITHIQRRDLYRRPGRL